MDHWARPAFQLRSLIVWPPVVISDPGFLPVYPGHLRSNCGTMSIFDICWVSIPGVLEITAEKKHTKLATILHTAGYLVPVLALSVSRE